MIAGPLMIGNKVSHARWHHNVNPAPLISASQCFTQVYKRQGLHHDTFACFDHKTEDSFAAPSPSLGKTILNIVLFCWPALATMVFLGLSHIKVTFNMLTQLIAILLFMLCHMNWLQFLFQNFSCTKTISPHCVITVWFEFIMAHIWTFTNCL